MDDDISVAKSDWLAHVDRVDSIAKDVDQTTSTGMESFLGHEDSDDCGRIRFQYPTYR